MKGTKSVIITGGSSGLGYECAKNLAKTGNGYDIVIACRDVVKGNKAANALKKLTKNNDIIALKLDLSSLDSIRQFVKAFSDPVFSPLSAVVCNAGLQIINGTQYTKEGYEATFGVNHLGHFLLVNLLLEKIEDNGRVIFVSSDTHDPMKKTGMPEPVYEKAEYLAYPEKSGKRLTGRERYTTSKLCNIYCTYGFDERVRAQANRKISFNAFNPGMMPGTGLARDYGAVSRFVWKYAMPLLALLKDNVHTARQSGKALASLVTDAIFENISGAYFDGAKRSRSSELSYNRENISDLWETSMKLAQLNNGFFLER